MSIVVQPNDIPPGGFTDIDAINPELDHRKDISVEDRSKEGVFYNSNAENVVAIVHRTDVKRVDLGDGNYDWSILNQTSTADYLKTELRSHLWKQLESLKLIVSESEANKPTKDQVMEDLSKVNLGKPANMDVRIKAAWLTQPSLAQGTGCLIGPDRILTCAHMDVTEDGTKSEDETFIEHPEQFVALLGYRAANFPGGKLAALDPWRVREIERVELFPWRRDDIIRSGFRADARFDLAIAKLKPLDQALLKQFNIIPPSGIRVSSTPPQSNLSVHCIGCPGGMPLKLTTGKITQVATTQLIAATQLNQNPGGAAPAPVLMDIPLGYYSTTLELFRGNSGSPILDSAPLVGMFGGPTSIVGVASSVSLPLFCQSWNGIKRPVVDELKAVMQKLGSGELDKSMTLKRMARLYANRPNGLFVSGDRTSFTFAKVLSTDPAAQNMNKACRVDPVGIMLLPFQEFAGYGDNYAAIDIDLNMADRVGPGSGPTIALGPANLNISCKASASDLEDEWAEYNTITFSTAWGKGYTAASSSSITHSGFSVKSVQRSTFGTTFPEAARTTLGSLGDVNGTPGLLVWIEPGTVRFTLENSYARAACKLKQGEAAGVMTVRYVRAASSDWPVQEEFVFQGRLMFEEKLRSDGFYYGRVVKWAGPIVKSAQLLNYGLTGALKKNS